MCHSTLAINCFIDDFLKASGHREDVRVEVSDAEVITIAIIAIGISAATSRNLV